MEEVLRRTLLAPLASPCFLLCLIGVETEGLLDYQGRAGDHFPYGGTFARSYSVSRLKSAKKRSEKRSETWPKKFQPLSGPLKIFHRHFSKRLSPPKFAARICRGGHGRHNALRNCVFSTPQNFGRHITWTSWIGRGFPKVFSRSSRGLSAAFMVLSALGAPQSWSRQKPGLLKRYLPFQGTWPSLWTYSRPCFTRKAHGNCNEHPTLYDGQIPKSSFHSRCHFGTSVGWIGTLRSRGFVAVVVSCAV